jgi:hypothetical protein
MKPPPPSPKAQSEIEIVRLVWLAIFISIFSFLFYLRHEDVLLYGDAVAHINIARRVFDSKTPGPLQLGTVWLPVPHLLILPFIVSKSMWQSGIGGSIPSMAGFVLGVLGIFRLVRSAFAGESKVLAWAAAVLYAANPNLIYMQSTAMGESLYLGLFIWAVVYFAEFEQGKAKSLTKCGWCLLAACLTRYDGWFLGAGVVAAMFVVFAKRVRSGASAAAVPISRISVAKFLLLAAAGPVLWLAYNAAVYRNTLEFVNGPYSAKAIEQKSGTVNPAKRNLFAAGSYFVKAAEANVAEANWMGRLWLALALLGGLMTAFTGLGRSALLLWAPLPFYALSVAYGSVPIFVPAWWPFSHYNVRYGLQLLPAFAVFAPVAVSFLVKATVKVPQVQAARHGASVGVALAALSMAAASYAAIWRVDPICYREAKVNTRGRVALDRQLAGWLGSLPADSTLLMYLGEHAGALERAGVPLKRVISEGNHRVWMQPSDPEGLWERALSDPAAYADFAIGFDGDPVWKAAQERRLAALVEVHTTGQPRAAIFQSRTPANAPHPGSEQKR